MLADQAIPEMNRLGNHRTGITESNSERVKFGSVIVLCVMAYKPPLPLKMPPGGGELYNLSLHVGNMRRGSYSPKGVFLPSLTF